MVLYSGQLEPSGQPIPFVKDITHTHTHTHTLSLSQTHLTEDNDLLSGGGFLFFFVSLALTKWGKTLPGGGRAYF